jgi:hypothetical protein
MARLDWKPVFSSERYHTMNTAQICRIFLAFLLISCGLTTAAADGPVSPLYLTGINTHAVLPGCSGNGNVNELHVIQGANEIRSWCLPGGDEDALAVGSTIRTLGFNYQVDPTGKEYTLAGNYTGVSFVNTIGTGDQLYDGTRDATHNYAISTGGHVFSFDLKWRNWSLLFTIPATSNFDLWNGIAYDASSDSLWISNYGQSTVKNYSLAGVLLVGFTLIFPPGSRSGPIGLALDPADQTLWTYFQGGILTQYSKAGTLLTAKTYPLFSTFTPNGAEFELPLAPGASPNHGGNAGDVTVLVTSTAIQPGAQVKLTGIGSDIVGLNASLVDVNLLRSTFDLTGAVPGLRNVVILNPDNSSTTLTGAFTIDQNGAAQIWVNTIGSSQIRFARETTYYISYGNNGNVDAYLTPIWVRFPNYLTWRLPGGITTPPATGAPIDWSQVPPQIQDGPDTIIPLLVPRIEAGGTGVIPITLTAPTAPQTFTIQTWATAPWLKFLPKSSAITDVTAAFNVDLFNCINAVGNILASAIAPEAGCLQNLGAAIISTAETYTGELVKATQNNEPTPKVGVVLSQVDVL